jgi:SAM-dependent methyltransferase
MLCVTAPTPSSAHSSCTRCSHAGELLYADLRDRLFGVEGVWSLWKCPGCDQVWLDPQPAASEIAGLYRDYYTHDDAVELSLFRRAVLRGIPAAVFGYADAVTDPAERALGRLLSLLGPLRETARHGLMWLPGECRGKLLDVGCGSGLFLKHMQALGWEVSGVEPDRNAAQIAREALVHGDVVAGELHQAEFAPESFDAVTLSHVIEHVPDPDDALAICHRLLRPGGRLVLSTPNSESLGVRRFGRSWLHWDPPRHLQLFNPRTLPQLVSSAGLEIESLDTSTNSAHFIWVTSSLIERQGSLPGIDLSPAGVALWLQSLVYWAVEFLLTRLGRPCGEELILVARKAPRSNPERT